MNTRRRARVMARLFPSLLDWPGHRVPGLFLLRSPWYPSRILGLEFFMSVARKRPSRVLLFILVAVLVAGLFWAFQRFETARYSSYELQFEMDALSLDDVRPQDIPVAQSDEPANALAEASDEVQEQFQDLQAQSQALASEQSVILLDQTEVLEQERLEASRMFVGEAEIGHNAPDRMRFGEQYDMELAFLPEGATEELMDVLSEGLPGDIIEADGVAYSKFVQATLEGGEDFVVVPSEPQRRRVVDAAPILWDWRVEPQTFGEDRRVTFRLEALVFENGSYEVVARETYRATVQVDVGWMDWSLFHVQRAKPLTVAIGGGITFLITVLTFYLTFIRPRQT